MNFLRIPTTRICAYSVDTHALDKTIPLILKYVNAWSWLLNQSSTARGSDVLLNYESFWKGLVQVVTGYMFSIEESKEGVLGNRRAICAPKTPKCYLKCSLKQGLNFADIVLYVKTKHEMLPSLCLTNTTHFYAHQMMPRILLERPLHHNVLVLRFYHTVDTSG